MTLDDYHAACLEACRERQAVPLAARHQRDGQRHRGAREVMLNANAWQAGRALPSDYPIDSIDVPMPLGWHRFGAAYPGDHRAWLEKVGATLPADPTPREQTALLLSENTNQGSPIPTEERRLSNVTQLDE